MRFSRTNMRLAAARCRSLSRKIGVQTAEFSITAFCWREAGLRKSRTYERHNAEIRLELFKLSQGCRAERSLPVRQWQEIQEVLPPLRGSPAAPTGPAARNVPHNRRYQQPLRSALPRNAYA